jgi:hypothetical protein
MSIVNATIIDAEIKLDREVFLSVWLTLDYGGAVQGFGGFVLGGVADAKAGEHANQPNLAAEFIVRCLEIGGVDQFSKLVGRNIRVNRNYAGFNTTIVAIGHITKDIWFNPTETFKSWKAGTK